MPYIKTHARLTGSNSKIDRRDIFMTLDGREVFENQIQKAQTMNEKDWVAHIKIKNFAQQK